MAKRKRSGGRPQAVGAYIFAGGFTLGMKQHFDIVCHLEETNYGVATMRHNQPEIPVYFGQDEWPINTLKKTYSSDNPLDLIYGNPPCAAWSQANQAPGREGAGADWRTDERVHCTARHFELLRQLRPKAWVWESVVRAYTHGNEFVEALAAKAKRLGYSVTYVLHDARYLGVPQKRARFFFVAHKYEFKPEVYDWSVTTVGEALSRLNDIGEPYANGIDRHAWLVPEVRQGENMWAAYNRIVPEHKRKIGARGQVIGRPAFLYRRPKIDEPSCVVMNDKLHPTEHRALTINELKALCGFPALYEFIGSGPVSQMARGVCPPVGEWIGRELARSLKQAKPVVKPTIELVDLRHPF